MSTRSIRMLLSASVILFCTHTAQAARLNIDPVKVHFTEQSIGIGYTLKTSGDECWLGVPPSSFGEATEATVVLRHVPKKRVKESFGDEISLSPLFRFKVKDPAVLSQPLWISIAPRKTTDQTFVIKMWNETAQSWDTLESTLQGDGARVQAQVTGQTGIVGVFEAPKPVEVTQHTGKASWFSGNSMYGYGSAMNIFPIGTRVRVTNVDNGKQVETTIVSTGPFVPGRIIDLSKSAFNTISNTSVGVINVIVEEIKE